MACHSNVNNVRNSSTEISTMKANFKLMFNEYV